MDSDEEEMAELRTNARYGIGPKKPTSAPPDAGAPASGAAGPVAPDSPDEATSRRARTAKQMGAQPGPRGGPQSAEDSSDGEAAEELTDSMRAFFPTTFGKRKQKTTLGLEVHDNMKRQDAAALKTAAARSVGVHFGSKVSEASSATSAQRRQAKVQELGKTPLPAADTAAGDEAAGGPPEAAEDVEMQPAVAEVDELPEPGKEAEVLPVSHEVVIPSHNKAVTALSIDPKGIRMITGSMDGNLRFFDFSGMNEDKNSFRNLEPVEGHLVQSVSFSTTGGCALVVCSDSHARIYDRDGSSKPIQSTVKGDMYVRDMQHTKGHTQTLTDGVWHPLKAECWLTSSLDGTLRLWDIHAPPVGMDQTLPSVHVLKTVDKRNVCVGGGSGRDGGLHPCCCAFSPTDGKKIVGGCSDGSVQMFFEKARYQKADRILRTAHTGAVLGITFFGAGDNFMATRSADSTLKIWDCRMLSDAKGPLRVFSDLPANHEKTNVCTSPDGKYLVTGTSFRKGEKNSASLVVYNTLDMSVAKTLDFGKRSVIRLAWPQALNQVVVGTSTGEVVMLYSPFSSKKGAMHFVGKRAKSKETGLTGGKMQEPIFNMTDKDDIKKFYSTGHGNMFQIRRSEARASQKTLIPERPPQQDIGRDSADFQAAILKAGAKRIVVEKDSQKALLAYDDKAKSKGLFLEAAYSKTQPTKLLDYTEEVAEGDKRMSSNQAGDFCRKCGMKLCRCVDYSVYGQGGKKQRLA